MKNPPRGKRANAPAPYSKYGKKPYQYSNQYYAWRRQHTSKAAEAEREHKQKQAQQVRA